MMMGKIVTFICIECDVEIKAPNPIGLLNCPNCGKPMIIATDSEK